VKNVAQRISGMLSMRRSSKGWPTVIYVSVIIVCALTKDNILTLNKFMCVLHACANTVARSKRFGIHHEEGEQALVAVPVHAGFDDQIEHHTVKDAAKHS